MTSALRFKKYCFRLMFIIFSDFKLIHLLNSEGLLVGFAKSKYVNIVTIRSTK